MYPVVSQRPRRPQGTPGLERVPTAHTFQHTLFLSEHGIGIEHNGALYPLKIPAGQLILN